MKSLFSKTDNFIFLHFQKAIFIGTFLLFYCVSQLYLLLFLPNQNNPTASSLIEINWNAQ